MNIEQQVVSLDLSKQLKEAGYKQEGLWWWRPTYSLDIRTLGKRESYLSGDKPTDKNELRFTYVAPTVAELGERLPEELHIDDARLMLSFTKYRVSYSTGQWGYSEGADTEANARAKMWLYLKKEGLL